MNNAQQINQESGDYEYYTPIKIVNAAREVMGNIDLDPASTRKANKQIKAGKIFTEKQNGLKKKWFGNVWMNHPFTKEGTPLWINKLCWEYVNGEVEAACCITYANTDTKWFNLLMDFPQCFLSPRTHFIYPDSTKRSNCTKGSVVTYLGHDVKKFIKVFDVHFGTVKL